MFRKRVSEYISDSTLIDFLPHSEANCFVCTKRAVKLKSFSLIRTNNLSSQEQLRTNLIIEK